MKSLNLGAICVFIISTAIFSAAQSKTKNATTDGTIEQTITAAQNLLKSGDGAGAIKILQTALESNPQNNDLCIGNLGAWAQGMTQVYLGSTLAESVANTRIITRGLAGVKNMFYYATAKSLPDASWALFNVGSVLTPNPQVNVWMAKLPPLAKQDNVDRSTFVRAPIQITAPQGQGIASAEIEFGYAEHGATGQFYCTSRREACVATAAEVSDAAPFHFAQTETYTRMPCASTCTITLPVLPVHVAYYQVKFYDAQGALVADGDRGVTVEGLPVKSSNTAASR